MELAVEKAKESIRDIVRRARWWSDLARRSKVDFHTKAFGRNHYERYQRAQNCRRELMKCARDLGRAFGLYASSF